MKILTIFCTILITLSLPAWAGDVKESAFDRVMRTGTIKCGYGISPPLLEQDTNTKKLYGMDYEVWQEVGKELDLKIDFSEEAGWGNFIEGLRTGRYDAFCSQLWADPVRARQLTMSVPVMYSFIDAFVRADDHRFDSDIEKANSPTITIPAIEGDVSVTMAKNRFPSAKIDYLPQTATVSDMFMSVISKKSDIIFVDQGSFLVFNKANPRVLRKLENFPPTFTYAGYYAVMGGELRLRDLIDIALQKMIDDGRMEKLAKKYSTDYKAPHKNFEASK